MRKLSWICASGTLARASGEPVLRRGRRRWLRCAGIERRIGQGGEVLRDHRRLQVGVAAAVLAYEVLASLEEAA